MDEESDISDDDRGNKFTPDLPREITKEILEAAPADKWGRPKHLYEVSIHYVGRLQESGEEFASTRATNEPLRFVYGKGYGIKAWDLAVSTMRRGELSRFTMPPEFAYGAAGLPSKVPPNASVVFDIEFLGWERRVDLFGDEGVIRTCVQAGDGGDKPKDGAEVVISLRATVANESVTETDGVIIEDEGEVVEDRLSFEYAMGSGALGEQSKVVDKALRTMKKGGVISLACTKEYAYGDRTPRGANLQLSLHEIYKTEDISWAWIRKGTVVKKRIKEADGYSAPQEADIVKLRVEKVTDGTQALAGFSGPVTLEFTLGNGEVGEAFEMAAKSMSKTERACVSSRNPALVKSTQLGLTEITANVVDMTVELLDFQHFEQTSPESWLAYGLARKEVGGQLFKQQRWLMAYARYEHVLQSFSNGPTFRGDDAIQADELKSTCQLNMAACLLKVNNYRGAVQMCTQVLQRQRHNVKALFRRASAYHANGEFMLAQKDLELLLEHNADNVDAKRLLVQVKQAQREEDKASKAVFAKMYAGGSNKPAVNAGGN